MIDPNQDPEFRELMEAANAEAQSAMRMLVYSFFAVILAVIALVYFLVR